MSIGSVGLITKMHTSNELISQSFEQGGVILMALQIALRMTSDFLVYRSNIVTLRPDRLFHQFMDASNQHIHKVRTVENDHFALGGTL